MYLPLLCRLMVLNCFSLCSESDEGREVMAQYDTPELQRFFLKELAAQMEESEATSTLEFHEVALTMLSGALNVVSSPALVVSATAYLGVTFFHLSVGQAVSSVWQQQSNDEANTEIGLIMDQNLDTALTYLNQAIDLMRKFGCYDQLPLVSEYMSYCLMARKEADAIRMMEWTLWRQSVCASQFLESVVQSACPPQSRDAVAQRQMQMLSSENGDAFAGHLSAYVAAKAYLDSRSVSRS